MLIGFCVFDGKDVQGCDCWEVIVNGNDGVVFGCELEIVDLLCFVQCVEVCNIVWLIVDVYYCVVYYYSLECVVFKDFVLFWEFVVGFFNVGSFGFNVLDGMFGLQVMFQKVLLVQNSFFFVGYQFFGEVEIDV